MLPLTAWTAESTASSTSSATESSVASIIESIAAAAASYQAGSSARTDADRCPLRVADLDKVTPYRWRFGQYRADRGFIPDLRIRFDMCELIGRDDKGVMRSGVMVNIATGASAELFAKHWHAACADSIQRELRGKVQPIAGVPGGQQCVTPSGSSSFYWIESPGRTVQVELENEDPAMAKVFPKVVGAVVR